MLAKKGSSMCSEEPLFYTRVEVKLNNGDPCSGQRAQHERLKLMQAVHSMENRKTWDKTVKNAENVNTEKKILINHVVNESPFSAVISARDTVDKKFKFTHDNAYYIYTSCVPNEVLPSEKNIERMEMVFSICKFSFIEMLEEKKMLVVETIVQTEFNMGKGVTGKLKKAGLMKVLPE
jgi:hypothetical protein